MLNMPFVFWFFFTNQGGTIHVKSLWLKYLSIASIRDWTLNKTLIWVFFTFKMRGSSSLISMQRCLNSLDNICRFFLDCLILNLSFWKAFYFFKWWEHQIKYMKKQYIEALSKPKNCCKIYLKTQKYYHSLENSL